MPHGETTVRSLIQASAVSVVRCLSPEVRDKINQKEPSLVNERNVEVLIAARLGRERTLRAEDLALSS